MDTRGPARARESFTAGLARGYALLSQYENYVMEDAAAAARFADKAARTGKGQDVPPDAVDKSAPQAAELESARNRLMAVRKTLDTRTDNALKIAEAQINFDCWQERGRLGEDGAFYCQKRFEDSLAGLEQPETATTFTVHFDENKSTPQRTQFAVIRQAAHIYENNPGWVVHLTGYAEPSGKKELNAILAVRRTIAVRNFLIQNGVGTDKIVIGALWKGKSGRFRGEDANPEARRVDIHVLPADQDKPDDGPDAVRLAPHYFRENDINW